MMILATHGDNMEGWVERQYHGARAVGTSQGVVWNIQSISPITLIIPDMLHTLNHGILKHWMDWFTSIHEPRSMIDQFIQL
jgi:hypothetical protein